VVRGARVHIGRGCRIGTVEYSERCDCDPDAQVGAARKAGEPDGPERVHPL
jgi:hypothetical protein